MVGDSIVPLWAKTAVNLTLLGVVTALLAGLSFYCYRKGVHVERAAWELKEKNQTIKNQDATIAQWETIIKARDSRDKANQLTSQRVLAILDGLRDRPARPELPSSSPDSKQGATGAELYLPDSRFLAGEAARADRLRAALAECYAAVDAASAARH